MSMDEYEKKDSNYYNRLYSGYIPFTKSSQCSAVTVIDLAYANKLLARICKTFHLPPSLQAKRVMDVGCGLGFMAEAFRLRGAEVWALDCSHEAIKQVRSIFPGLTGIVGRFPDVSTIGAHKFDIIFERDLSILSTINFDNICNKFLLPARELLAEDGIIICGYRSDFTGLVDANNWANWPYNFITWIKKKFSVLGPKLVDYNLSINPLLALVCKKSRVRIPFYFIIKRETN